MIRFLNKHHRWLMIVIAILAIPFVFYFNKTDFGAQGGGDLGTFHGRRVTQIDFQRNARLLRLSSELGMSTFVQDLTSGAQSENDLYLQFMWNRLVLRHEAEQFGIEATGTEIADLVKTFSAFRGASGFDINKYNEFTKTSLAPMGFTEAQIEELAADEICMGKLKSLIGIGVQAPESEMKTNYERAYGKIDATVVRLRSADFAGQVNVTAEDIQKYFDAHKAQLNTDEARKVKFVAMTLNEEQKKLTGKPRTDALQKLADRANDFTQALLEKGAQFDQVAAKFQVPIAETGEFTASQPDPQLATNPQVAQTAFRLTEKDPNSDAVEGGDGFYVLHLTHITPVRPLTLDEARPKIAETLKAEAVRKIVSTKASEAAAKMREALKASQPIDAALQQVALKAEKVPPFALADPPKVAPPDQPKDPNPDPPDLQQIKQAAADLNAGDVSEFVPTADGGLVVAVEKREPPDAAKMREGVASMQTRYLRSEREVVFADWLRERRQAAGIREPAQPEMNFPS
jgi:peptidyl-prolyl cis-trans isomerase D